MLRQVDEALRAHFKPEFLNRVDETIVFHQLGREHIARIVEIQLERVKQLLADRRIEIEVTDEAKKLLAEKGYDPHYGARPLKRVIQRMLQDPLAMKILEGEFPEGSKVRSTRASRARRWNSGRRRQAAVGRAQRGEAERRSEA